MWKLAAGVGAFGLALCMASDPGLAVVVNRPAPHFAAPRVGGSFRPAVRAQTFRPARVGTVRPAARVGTFRPANTTSLRAARITTFHPVNGNRVVRTHTRNPALTHGAIGAIHGVAGAHAVAGGTHVVAHQAVQADPHVFAAHRAFVVGHPFFHFAHFGWHPYHHLGWIGPLFWPFAYGDFFYYALWPDYYGYYDPFWIYGYGDIYAGIFSPYDYGPYVNQPAQMTVLTKQMAQSCADEATEVTGWPIDRIKEIVQPDGQQGVLLDDLGNAVVKASDIIKANCPTGVAFTPVGRLAAMQQRLQGMVQAIGVVQPALTAFYDSLSDEQKARFNAMTPAPDAQAQQRQQASDGSEGGRPADAPNQQSACSAAVTAWPTEQIEQVVQLTDAQRAKLSDLQSANQTAANVLQSACPTDVPTTPPGRLETIGKRLAAILQAVEMVQPSLQEFYASLNDAQKSRFNTIGQRLYASTR